MRGTASAELASRVCALGPWFHDLDLHGVRTAPDHPLGDFLGELWKVVEPAFPADMRGVTVLDIGCNAGFYSIEMKRRGADRVVGVDSDQRYLEQARFAAGIAGVEIEFHKMSVYDVPDLRERFDVVLFMGVLYHLRYPLLALDLLFEHVTRDLVVFQSMLRGSHDTRRFADDYEFDEMEHFDNPAYPRLYFVEHRYCGDETNWWIPNRACAEAMLRSSGFDVIGHPEEEVFICQRRDAMPEHMKREGERPAWLKR
jgi:tRNA (mo5U34)-methyltransferase